MRARKNSPDRRLAFFIITVQLTVASLLRKLFHFRQNLILYPQQLNEYNFNFTPDNVLCQKEIKMVGRKSLKITFNFPL